LHSYEERMKAVKLYIKYDLSVADTIRELGYPTRKTLVRWYKEYLEDGDLHKKYKKKPRFTREQMKKAVDYYLEHGRCLRRTVRALGYPCRTTLAQWIDKLAPGERKVRITQGSVLQFSEEQKKEAVLSLCTRDTSARKVAEEQGTTRCNLYAWKRKLLGKESEAAMNQGTIEALPNDKDELIAQLESLKKQVYRLQLEIDILNKAAEVIKKDQGIDLQEMTNREKVIVVDALRRAYPLSELLDAIGIAKSSYFYQKKALCRPDKYNALREKVRETFSKNKCVYGYRRVHAMLRRQGITCSEKVVRRIMWEEHLVVQGKKKRKYSSYLGEISPAVSNLLERDFYAGKPNEKWLSDLTEFHIPAGKVYLSPIIDCFDGMVVSWAIGTSPDADLVNTMLDSAVACLSSGERPILHTDRGCHYRWPGWISRMNRAGLVRSMSRKGCSPDNAACEGFFGTLKNEMFYTKSWEGVSLEKFIDELDGFIRWYNESRIKMTLGAMSPIDYRRSLGLIA
jgi:putative transposase